MYFFIAVLFGFESVTYSTSEADSAFVDVSVIKYDGSSTLPLSVRLSTMAGSASAAQDYSNVDGQLLTFSPEQERNTFRIAIIDDTTVEDTEQFYVLLTQSDPQARVIQKLNVTTVTIEDNDGN